MNQPLLLSNFLLHNRFVDAASDRKEFVFSVSSLSCGSEVAFDDNYRERIANTLVFQRDPQIQEVWDSARRISCTMFDQYSKQVKFQPFQVSKLKIRENNFEGGREDSIKSWMEVKRGRFPKTRPLVDEVQIGEPLSLEIYLQNEGVDNLDLGIQDCWASTEEQSSARGIQLSDRDGCPLKRELISYWKREKTYIDSKLTLVAFANLSAFKFTEKGPISIMCNVQICYDNCLTFCDVEQHERSLGREIRQSTLRSVPQLPPIVKMATKEKDPLDSKGPKSSKNNLSQEEREGSSSEESSEVEQLSNTELNKLLPGTKDHPCKEEQKTKKLSCILNPSNPKCSKNGNHRCKSELPGAPCQKADCSEVNRALQFESQRENRKIYCNSESTHSSCLRKNTTKKTFLNKDNKTRKGIRIKEVRKDKRNNRGGKVNKKKQDSKTKCPPGSSDPLCSKALPRRVRPSVLSTCFGSITDPRCLSFSRRQPICDSTSKDPRCLSIFNSDKKKINEVIPCEPGSQIKDCVKFKLPTSKDNSKNKKCGSRCKNNEGETRQVEVREYVCGLDSTNPKCLILEPNKKSILVPKLLCDSRQDDRLCPITQTQIPSPIRKDKSDISSCAPERSGAPLCPKGRDHKFDATAVIAKADRSKGSRCDGDFVDPSCVKGVSSPSLRAPKSLEKAKEVVYGTKLPLVYKTVFSSQKEDAPALFETTLPQLIHNILTYTLTPIQNNFDYQTSSVDSVELSRIIDPSTKARCKVGSSASECQSLLGGDTYQTVVSPTSETNCHKGLDNYACKTIRAKDAGTLRNVFENFPQCLPGSKDSRCFDFGKISSFLPSKFGFQCSQSSSDPLCIRFKGPIVRENPKLFCFLGSSDPKCRKSEAILPCEPDSNDPKCGVTVPPPFTCESGTTKTDCLRRAQATKCLLEGKCDAGTFLATLSSTSFREVLGEDEIANDSTTQATIDDRSNSGSRPLNGYHRIQHSRLTQSADPSSGRQHRARERRSIKHRKSFVRVLYARGINVADRAFKGTPLKRV